jgi:protein gp138
MDRRERAGDFQAALRVALSDLQTDLWTGMPGIVQSFNAVAITAVVQPAIQAQVQKQDGSWSNVTMPLLLDCPVHFQSGGGATLTFPLKKGDEVWVSFANRCIDAWWSQGGVQPQAELRMHDLSDGFCFPKIWSKPNAIANISTTTAQLRSDDGQAYVELDPAGHIVNIVAPGGINITGPVAVTGAITATGNVTAGQGGADQASLQLHIHPANNTPPTPGH